MRRDEYVGGVGAAGMIRNDATCELSDEPDATIDPVGVFYAWWRGDLLPTLHEVAGLVIEAPADERLVAGVSGRDAKELRERMRRGHRPWLARIAGEPVGCGWVATTEAAIGELGLAFSLPPGNRYLWDFVTVPTWRGRGIYPRLLHAILAGEQVANRFWVGHDWANRPSARGVIKAGFRPVATGYRLQNGDLTLVPSGPIERAEAAAALLDLSLTRHQVTRRA